MKQRLLSLDVLRGLTVAAMILVNNGWNHDHYEPLRHVDWNGLTVCDLVFPFFLFMVGVSIYISMSRHAGEPGMVKKILKRTFLMFIIGTFLTLPSAPVKSSILVSSSLNGKAQSCLKYIALHNTLG